MNKHLRLNIYYKLIHQNISNAPQNHWRNRNSLKKINLSTTKSECNFWKIKQIKWKTEAHKRWRRLCLQLCAGVKSVYRNWAEQVAGREVERLVHQKPRGGDLRRRKRTVLGGSVWKRALNSSRIECLTWKITERGGGVG